MPLTHTVSISDLMANSGVAFGTSGARGLVSAMTDTVCFAYTCAFLQHLDAIDQFSLKSAVAIAGDLRPSSPRILTACATAIRHLGGKVDFCGFVPSPAVALHGFKRGIPSLMVTGSHIPHDRNGIKFNRIDGEVLKADELAMRAQHVTLPNLFDAAGMLRETQECGELLDAASPYASRYADFFGQTALAGMKLGVYEHSAVGRDVLVDIVARLGADVVRLGRSDSFIPVDTEAVRPEDQALALDWVRQYNLDAILSTDGDSDRPLMADETGVWMRGDVLGILCARSLGLNAVATPVSCNSAVELSGAFREVRRTRIGSPFVIEAMDALLKEFAGVCGYEANGGFLLATPVEAQGRTLAALPTRDAVLPMIAALVAARRQGISLGALQAQLPPRFTFSERLQDYPTRNSQQLLNGLQEGLQADVLDRASAMFGELVGTATAFDTTDGLRMTFEGGDIIHLRPSGNAPELRCYTESATRERATALNAAVLDMIDQGEAVARG